MWVLMKTTVEIPDSLFQEVRAFAESRGVSFRQLVEEGLRTVVREGQRARKPFRLRDGSYAGKGLQRDLSWNDIREAIYTGRGE
ncbi:MAG: DUF2191 domain-containing protein [Terriglobia bacterium]|nr:MAG: DUF2191 domain-containing protein [Terriglobia bacterium]